MSGISHLLADDSAAPMTLEDFELCADHLARCEQWPERWDYIMEAQEFFRELGADYGFTSVPFTGGMEQLIKAMQTWVTRQMGAAFDPEKHCPYTGRRLWKFPCLGTGPKRNYMMGYFREPNAYLLRVRECTPEEVAWIAGKPEAFAEAKARFEAWRQKCSLDG